jgi:hypothetical protein
MSPLCANKPSSFLIDFDYLCPVQLRKKILSHFLLAIYLLVVLHHSILHSHAWEFADTAASKPHHKHKHKHKDFNNGHHKHQFHVGIFHFLEHLFENLHHSDDPSNEHVLAVQNNTSKKLTDLKCSVTAYFDKDSLVAFAVDAESLPDPPYHLFLLQKLKLPSTPLRAPPSFV